MLPRAKPRPAGKKGGDEGWSLQYEVGLAEHTEKWNELLVSLAPPSCAGSAVLTSFAVHSVLLEPL